VRTVDHGTFFARHVISTLPVPVLAQGGVEFTPPLPIEKRVAIHGITMGYGTLNKVFLLFESAFWPTQVDFCAYLPDASITDDELRVFMSLHDFHPGLMCVFLHGRHAERWEGRSDEEHVTRVLQTLRLMFGDAAVTPVKKAYVTRWRSDPFARGCYAVPSFPFMREFVSVLAADLEKKLFFAGEATHAHFGVAHGAMASGRREAETILRLYAKSKV